MKGWILALAAAGALVAGSSVLAGCDKREDASSRSQCVIKSSDGVSYFYGKAEIAELEREGVSRQITADYLDIFQPVQYAVERAFSSRDILDVISRVHNSGLKPETLEGLISALEPPFAAQKSALCWDFTCFYELGNSVEVAKARDIFNALGKPKNYGHRVVIEALEKNMSSEDIKKYSAVGGLEFNGDINNARYAIKCFANKVSPEDLAKYGQRSVHCFNTLQKSNCMHLAKAYDSDLSALDMMALNARDISPEFANPFIELNRKYGSRISAQDIFYFSQKAIPFETVKEIVIEEQARERVRK